MIPLFSSIEPMLSGHSINGGVGEGEATASEDDYRALSMAFHVSRLKPGPYATVGSGSAPGPGANTYSIGLSKVRAPTPVTPPNDSPLLATRLKDSVPCSTRADNSFPSESGPCPILLGPPPIQMVSFRRSDHSLQGRFDLPVHWDSPLDPQDGHRARETSQCNHHQVPLP